MPVKKNAFSCSKFLLLLLLSPLSFAQALPADINPESLARLPHLNRQGLSQEELAIYNALPALGSDGVLGGPLAFAAYNLGVAKSLFDLHNAAVGGVLDAHTRELAIMVACRETNYDLEWNGHETAALNAGVDPKVLNIVLNRQALTDLNENDALVISFGRQMLSDKVVDSDTFAKGVELFGERGMMDMVAVMNTYAVSGFFAIAVDEHMPADRTRLTP